MSKICEWEQCRGYGHWETGCGRAFTIDDGTPATNEMKYCPYCGKEIKEVEGEEEESNGGN